MAKSCIDLLCLSTSTGCFYILESSPIYLLSSDFHGRCYAFMVKFYYKVCFMNTVN